MSEMSENLAAFLTDLSEDCVIACEVVWIRRDGGTGQTCATTKEGATSQRALLLIGLMVRAQDDILNALNASRDSGPIN